MNAKPLLFSLAIISFLFLACQPAGEKKNGDGEEKAEETMSEEKTPAQNSLTQAEIDKGWTLLFDGKSISQWKGYCTDEAPDRWEISDGTLHFNSSEEGDMKGGDIITRKKFKNFHFKLEWKISKGGNSGIFYLARERCGEEAQAIYWSAPEMQVLDNVNHPDANKGIDGNRQAGSLYDLIPADPQNSKPFGEWNRVEIIVSNNNVTHKMNGEKVVEYQLRTDKWKEMVANSKFKDYDDFVNVAEEGHLGLQDHGNDVWYRNIKIKEL